MKKRRGNGEGSVCKRKSDGKWLAVLSNKRLDGSRRRVTKVARSKAHARMLLASMVNASQRIPPDSLGVTLGAFLNSWLATCIKGSREDSTHDSYEYSCRKYIIPHLGHIRVADLHQMQVREWMRVMRDEGVGGRTQENAFIILQAALNHAKLTRLATENACDFIERPKVSRKDIRPFNTEEATAILKAVEGHRMEAAFHLSLKHGLRQGELFGLQWRDVDWKAGTVRIERQAAENRGKVVVKPPKTKASIRTVHVTGDTLKSLRARRALARKEGHAGSEFVFTNKFGRVVQRSNFGNRTWTPLLAKLGIDHRGFHHCRHTAATLMLQSGTPVHIVSKVIGHSKPSVTLDIYAHVLSGDGQRASQNIAKTFGEKFG